MKKNTTFWHFQKVGGPSNPVCSQYDMTVTNFENKMDRSRFKQELEFLFDETNLLNILYRFCVDILFSGGWDRTLRAWDTCESTLDW